MKNMEDRMININWKDYARFGGIRSVLDTADSRGLKNKYINILHHKVLFNEIGNSLKGKRILDMGCGVGRFTQFLQDCGAEVIGIDSCKEMLKLNTGCKTLCANIYELPFDNKSFDAVLCVWVLQHLNYEDLNNTINEINRVLKDKGKVYMIEQVSLSTRLPLNYIKLSNKFILCDGRPIIYGYDKIIGIIRHGFIPEIFLSVVASIHLMYNKNIHVKDEDYLDYYMSFKKSMFVR